MPTCKSCRVAADLFNGHCAACIAEALSFMKASRAHPEVIHCPVHTHVKLRCPACAGAKGGAATSPKKAKAVRRNLNRYRRDQRQKEASS
jgi:hypothetical protein